jgi:predicted DNA binding CopG/RHH family protein
MARMKNYTKKLTEEKIDEIVIKEADDLSKWEKPIRVKAPQAISIRLSAELIQKVKLLAKIHKTNNYQDWLEKIIKERIHLEEELLESIKSNLTQS